MRQFLAWFFFIVTLLILIPFVWGLWLVRDKLPSVGIHIIDVSNFLLTLVEVAAFTGVVFGLIWLIRFALEPHFRDIGESGTMSYFLHRVREHIPYAPNIVDSTIKPVNQLALPSPVDSLGDILEKNLIGSNSEKFLLGMYSDNTPCYTLWDKVKSLIVAGMSGSGKTVTMVFIIVQLMLSKACRLTVIDPHWSKPDGLTNRLKPLAEYGTFVKGNSNDAISTAIREFREMLEGRINGDEITCARLLVIDEWNRIASRSKDVFEDVKWIVEEIAQEGRGYQVYVLLAGQIWMPSKSGGSSIIESIQSAYVHRIKTKQARFIVDNEIAKQTEKMVPGHVFFSDANGDSEQLIIPECKYRDAATVRDMLKGSLPMITTTPYTHQVGTSQTYNPYQLASPMSPVPGSTSEVLVTPYSQPLQLPAQTAFRYQTKPLLTPDQHTIYEAVNHFVATGQRISSRAVAEYTGMGKDKALALIKEMIELGYIQPTDRQTNTA